MSEDRGLNNKIKALEWEARTQQGRLKITMGGPTNDQSMSKRRADSDGGNDLKNKKSKSVSEGRAAYDSPSNNTLRQNNG